MAGLSMKVLRPLGDWQERPCVFLNCSLQIEATNI